MNTNRLTLLLILIFLAFVQLIMLMAAGMIPIVQSADLPQVQSTPTIPLSKTITTLATRSDLVVQAQVVAASSQWNRSHTLIETVYKLIVQQSLVGPTLTEVVVYTDGGFLPAEGLGMFSSHSPSFAVGEAVLVFLHRENNQYRVVDGEAGKFTLLQADAASAYYHDHLPLAQVATLLGTTKRVTQQSVDSTSINNAQADSIEPLVTATPTPLPKWEGATPKITLQVNLNSTQVGGPAGSAEQFLTAIKNALRTWSVVPEAGATFLYDGETTSISTGFNHKSEVVFMKKGANNQLGQAQIWFTSSYIIIEADLWINDDYVLDATGSPENGEIDLESAVLHELGHWLPLSHMSNSNAVMYPVLGSGMRKTVLSSDDIAGMIALYPCPAIPCIDPAYVGDGTATPTATITPTPTETTVQDATITPTTTMTPNATEPTPTLAPSAVTPTAQQNSFLPLVTR